MALFIESSQKMLKLSLIAAKKIVFHLKSIKHANRWTFINKRVAVLLKNMYG